MKKIDFKRLAGMNAEIPNTLLAQVKLAWPEIETALLRGHRLKDIHAALREAGIDIGYRLLSDYIGRIRRTTGNRYPPRTREEKEAMFAGPNAAPAVRPIKQQPGEVDPLINLRQRKSPRTFEYPSGPPDESKLI
jgi:hypothetical protein